MAFQSEDLKLDLSEFSRTVLEPARTLMRQQVIAQWMLNVLDNQSGVHPKHGHTAIIWAPD